MHGCSIKYKLHGRMYAVCTFRDIDSCSVFTNANACTLYDITAEKIDECQSFVLPNPDPKTRLKPNDIM